MSKKNDRKEKTNAVRMIEKAGVEYRLISYDAGGDFVSGTDVAKKTGTPEDRCFKTLVTCGNSGEHYVFCIPVNRELDLKKAARHFGEKKVEMIHEKELLGLTGYIKGGCSPVGMKKPFLTCIDASCEGAETIVVSGGKRGLHVELDPEDLAMICSADFDEISKK